VAPSATRIHGYVDRLRRRAFVIVALRAVWLALGAGGLVFLAFSLATGPVASVAWAAFGWSAVGLAALVAAWRGATPGWSLRGSGAARLLATRAPELASRTRSALELAGDARHSTALVEAHRARVAVTLEAVHPNEVLPWAWLRAPIPIVAFLLGAGALTATSLHDGAGAGAFALLHPGARAEGGPSLADVAGDVEVELLFPAYMRRPPETRVGTSVLAAPRGTTVVWRTRPRFDVVRATLHAGEQNVRLASRDGHLEGRFIVRESVPLRLDVVDLEGRALRDATRRTVSVLEDTAPEVQLVEPREDVLAELEDPVFFTGLATDDVALSSVDLVVETAEGETIRRPMERFAGGPESLSYEGTTRLSGAEVAARPGDALRVWIEARDTDDVSGPNVGRSESVTLTIASEATRRAGGIADLAQVLDAAVHALADRLELPVPQEPADAPARHDQVQRSTAALVEKLRIFAASDAPPMGVDSSVLSDMQRRLERAMAAEARAHRPVAPRSRRARADATLVDQLREDTLMLADLLGRARLDDAAAIARELENLRREMTSLLAELRRAESPEARRQLLGALRRARARLQELAARMAAMGEDVPREFLNAEALPEPEDGQDALDALEDAIESGDLDEAERHLTEFQREIDSLAQALGGASEAFAEARFGPRQRAMAEALDRLTGLETEQRRLADRTEQVRRSAAGAALRAAGDATRGAAQSLAERARSAAGAMRGVDAEALGPLDQEGLERTRQRLEDTADALAAGDLGEARAMALEASADAERLARDLELSALMFPGRDNQVGDAARAARRAADAARDLEHDLDDAIPRLSDFLEQRQRDQMRGDGDQQQRVGGAAEELRELFDSEPDGAPLSPEGSRAMEAAREAMRRAERSLERGKPVDASRSQQEASRALTELRERLEQQQQQQQQQGGGGSGGGSSQASPPDFRSRVEIPDADEGDRPSAIRRRVLDAMREEAPEGYEDAVRRYYEELLR